MALTKELLAQIEGLTDDQKSKIITLSANDENTVIGQKMADTWNKMDETFSGIFGVQKPTSEKSYNFWATKAKEAFESVSSVKDLNSKIKSLEETNKSLEEKIKSGASDETIKAENQKLQQKIKDNESIIQKLRTDVKSAEEAKEKGIAEERQKNVDLQFETTFASALQGVKFKPGLPEEAVKAMVMQAKQNIKSLGTSEIETIDGKTVITFRGENGLPITNKDNLQQPLTAQEAFLKSLEPIIDNGRKAAGGGGQGGQGSGSGSMSIGGAKTRQEAYGIIQKSLMERGITVDDKNYQDEFDKMATENNVVELPAQ